MSISMYIGSIEHSCAGRPRKVPSAQIEKCVCSVLDRGKEKPATPVMYLCVCMLKNITQLVHNMCHEVHAVIRIRVFIKITSVNLFEDCVHLEKLTIPYVQFEQFGIVSALLEMHFPMLFLF